MDNLSELYQQFNLLLLLIIILIFYIKKMKNDIKKKDKTILLFNCLNENLKKNIKDLNIEKSKNKENLLKIIDNIENMGSKNKYFTLMYYNDNINKKKEKLENIIDDNNIKEKKRNIDICLKLINNNFKIIKNIKNML